MRVFAWIALFGVGLSACGGASTDSDAGPPDGGPAAACTPSDQMVNGTELTLQGVPYDCAVASANATLITSAAELDSTFPNGSVPAGLEAVDFAMDRVVLGASNPAVQFAVDDGASLAVGIEGICQGIAPQCVAYIVRGTTQNTLRTVSCPYRGPTPCDAP